MEHGLLEALIAAVENLERENRSALDITKVKNELIEAGYSSDEAEGAIKLVEQRQSGDVRSPMRVLSLYERSQLTTDGCGLLIKLRRWGLLTDEHLELIIARAILLGEGPLDAENIRAMAILLLFDLKNQKSGFPIYVESGSDNVEN